MKTFPCYCCAVTTATLVSPQPKGKCFRGDQCPQPKCYHHTMMTLEMFEHWAQQKQELEAEYPYLLHPSPDLKKSQIFLASIDELQDDHNPYDITFRPATLDEGRHFDTLLSVELSYHGLPNNGTVTSKWESLRAALEAEPIYNLMTKLVASTDLESTFCAVEDAIPCILYGVIV